MRIHMRKVHKITKAKSPGVGRIPGPAENAYCKLCKRQFKYACILVTHKKKWHKNEMDLFNTEGVKLEENFSCQLCSESFITQNILNYHIRVRHDKEERRQPWKCSMCEIELPWSINRSTKLKMHMRTVHNAKGVKKVRKSLEKVDKESSFECILCYKTYHGKSGKTNLTRHKLKTHKEELHFFDMGIDNMELPFECPHCQKAFISPTSQRFHIRSVHSTALVIKEEQDFECCNRMFQDITRYRKHQHNVHRKKGLLFP